MEWSQQQLGEFLDALPDAAIVIGNGQRVVAANSYAATLFERPLSELLSTPLSSLLADPGVPPDEPQETLSFLSASEPTRRELTLLRKGKDPFLADIACRSITIEARLLGLAVIRDVSDRQRAEDDLRKTAERLRQAARVSEIGIFDHDHGTDFHYWSSRQYEMYGWPEDEPVTVAAFLERLHPADREAIAQGIRRAHDPAGDGSFDVQHRILRADGQVRWISTRSVTLFTGEGASRHPVRTVGACVDFTDRKLAEEALTLFRHAVDKASDAIFWLDRDGAFTYVNDEACRSLGYAREELMRLRLWDIEISNSREQWGKRWEHFERAQGRVARRTDSLHRRKDGTVFPVEVLGQHIALGDRWLHIACVRDISERRQAEEGRERLAAILDATPDLVAIADPAGDVLYLNQSARSLLGVERGDDSSKDLLAYGRSARAGHVLREAAIQGAIRDGLWKGETTFVNTEGQEIPFSQVVLAHRRSDGRVEFISTIARDLSKEKSLEAQFLQAQKMEAIGRLAGGVAHDFNNLLSVILSFAELASRELPPGHPSCSDIDEVKRAAERAAELTRRMLAFSRKQVLRPRVVDVSEVLRGMAPMMRRLIGEHIELRVWSGRDVGLIKADPNQLEQVILNLVVNSRDAMRDGGRLTLETGSEFLDGRHVESHVEPKPGHYVMIAVSDTGVGMSDVTKSRIFEPFFTTKGPGEGTGLGLSMVFGFVKQSGGDICIQSELGHGTTFKLYFPRTEDLLAKPAARTAPADSEDRGLVLLVEDEPQLRQLVMTVLRRSGYEVLVASGPLDALAMARETTRDIDLLLTDVVMPQMNGKELADRLVAERPRTRVLYMSGYAENLIAHHGILNEDVHFLPKPFTPEVLLATVRRALEGPPRHRP
jgi:two-component system cell cycle sensor histidine kinase/response regulator CckA